MTIDSNADSEISETEALAVYRWSIGSGTVQDVTGIASFTNLLTLDISGNPVTSVDVSPLSQLTRFTCNWSFTLASLTLGPALEELNVYWGSLTDIDLTPCPNLKALRLVQNQLQYLDLSGNPLLEVLSCPDNQLTLLDISALSHLRLLDCSHNAIAALDVSAKPELAEILLAHNQVGELDFTGSCSAAEIGFFITIDASHNHISSPDTSMIGQGITIRLHAEYNPELTTINVINGVNFFDTIASEPPVPGPGLQSRDCRTWSPSVPMPSIFRTSTKRF